MMMCDLMMRFRSPTPDSQHQHVDEGDSTAAGQRVQTSRCVTVANHSEIIPVLNLVWIVQLVSARWKGCWFDSGQVQREEFSFPESIFCADSYSLSIPPIYYCSGM